MQVFSSSGKCVSQLEYFHNLFLTQYHSHSAHLTAIGPQRCLWVFFLLLLFHFSFFFFFKNHFLKTQGRNVTYCRKWDDLLLLYSEDNLLQTGGFWVLAEILEIWENGGNNMTPVLKQQHLLWFKATQRKLFKQLNVLDCTDKCGSTAKTAEQKI